MNTSLLYSYLILTLKILIKVVIIRLLPFYFALQRSNDIKKYQLENGTSVEVTSHGLQIKANQIIVNGKNIASSDLKQKDN